MGTKKELRQIKELLQKYIDNNVLKKAELYEKNKENIEKVKLHLKGVHKFFDEENGSWGAKVEYNIPPVIIYFDENKEIVQNDVFRAINLLNLLSIEDTLKLVNELEGVKKSIDE